MNITNITVEKIEKDNPRYPDLEKNPDFFEVYLCSITFEGGNQKEVACFQQKIHGPMTVESAARMMRFFSASIERSEEAAAA